MSMHILNLNLIILISRIHQNTPSIPDQEKEKQEKEHQPTLKKVEIDEIFGTVKHKIVDLFSEEFGVKSKII